MWVEETKNGKYRVGERYTDPLTGIRKKVFVTINKNTRREINAAQQSIALKIQRKISTVNNKNVTLQQLANAYLGEQEKINRPSTVRRNRFAVNNIIEMFGDNVLVDSLNAGYVRQILLDSGKEKSTLNEFLPRFKALVRWGYDNDYVKDISFLSKLKPFKDDSPKENIKGKYLEREEMDILLKNMSSLRWRHFTEFLVLSGLRIGEALALTTKDIDLKKREITVNKTWDDNNRILNQTKTIAGTRRVYIQDELLALMKSLNSNALAESLVTRCDLLFQEEGKRYQYNAYRKYLQTTSQHCLGRRITPHALRHTHVSLLAEQGLSLDEISRRVGHKNSGITREVYFHVTNNLKKIEQKRIKEIKIL